MRATWRSASPGLAALVALAGCAFRPSGAPPADDDVTADAAGTPVDAAEPVDARALDAAVDAPREFDVESCPDGYQSILNTSSRYRMIDALAWAAAAATCRADLPGATHLVVLGGMGERDAVGAALFFRGEFRRTWIGVWNDGTGTRTVTGEDVYPGTELRPMQAVSWVRDLFTPFQADPVTTSYAALCECDGRPSVQ